MKNVKDYKYYLFLDSPVIFLSMKGGSQSVQISDIVPKKVNSDVCREYTKPWYFQRKLGVSSNNQT